MLAKSKAKNEAVKIMAALDDFKQIDLISKYLTAITVHDAYAIGQEIEYLRAGRKERIVGLKVGFTNRNIWQEYNVSSPIVGAIYERTHTRDTLVLNGLSARMGWASGFFIVAGLASLGLPGLRGFVSELLGFIGTFRTEPILGVLGIIGAAITATYILRLIGRVFFGPIDPKWESLKDLSPKEFGVGAFLLTPIVVVGIFPAPFLDVIRPSVDVILRGMS